MKLLMIKKLLCECGLLVQLLYLSGLSSGTVDLEAERKNIDCAVVCGVYATL